MEMTKCEESSFSKQQGEEICCMTNPFRMEKRKFDTSLEESLLVEQLNKMSMQERLKIEEEVHGVADRIYEDPTEMAKLLERMDRELRKIKKKQAYDKATFLSPAHVKDPKLLMRFIRSERYDPVKAAIRMIKYFELKLELFGPDRLVKDITFEDLDSEAQAVIASGRIWFTRHKDRSGRGVCISNLNSEVRATSTFSLMQCLWYESMHGTQDEEVQKNGVISVIYSVGNSSPEFFDMRRYIEAIPQASLGFHFCSNDPMMGIMLQWLQKLLNLRGAGRFRVHFGTPMEVRYAMLSYGISLEMLDCVTETGGVNMAKFSQELTERRRLEAEKEKALSDSRRVPFPRSCDVVLGKGRPFQTFPGNKSLSDILGARHEEYFSLKGQAEKTAMSTSIVKELKERGTRFLKRTPSGNAWEEITDLAARDKVAHGFRNKIQVFPDRKSGVSQKSSERDTDSPLYPSEDSSSFYSSKRPRLEDNFDDETPIDPIPFQPLSFFDNFLGR